MTSTQTPRVTELSAGPLSVIDGNRAKTSSYQTVATTTAAKSTSTSTSTCPFPLPTITIYESRTPRDSLTTQTTKPNIKPASATDEAAAPESVEEKYSEDYHTACMLFTCIFGYEPFYGPFTRLGEAYSNRMTNSVYWPIYIYKDNCFVVSCHRAKAKACRPDRLLNTEIATCFQVAKKVWSPQEEQGKKEEQGKEGDEKKLYIVLISVAANNVRVSRLTWRPEYHLACENHKKFYMPAGITTLPTDGPNRASPFTWVEDCVKMEREWSERWEAERKEAEDSSRAE